MRVNGLAFLGIVIALAVKLISQDFNFLSLDYTGYNNSARGTIQVPTDELAFVQIIAELDAFAQGAELICLLNFNGERTAIKIPNLRCVP